MSNRSTRSTVTPAPGSTVLLPMELIDRSINQKVLIITTGGREYYGTLKGYDDFVNVVLQDGIEIKHPCAGPVSESAVSDAGEIVNTYTGEMLISGQNIVMVVPGERAY